MAELIYSGKTYSTRSRISTLNQLIEEFENQIKGTSNKKVISELKSNIEAIKEIISEKENKEVQKEKSKKEKEKKNDNNSTGEKETKKKKKLVPSEAGMETVNQESIDDYDPESSTSFDEETGEVTQIALGLAKLSKEMKKTAVTLNNNEVRPLTDFYYQIQAFRIATENQVRSLYQGYDINDNSQNVSAMQWMLMNIKNTENSAKQLLEEFSNSNAITRWCKSIKGIGPIISSCLYAYFNIKGVNSAGNFWSYAGLNDNNNPWLGKERATEIVNELFLIRKIKNDAFTKVLNKYKIKIKSKLADDLEYDENKILDSIRKTFKNNLNTILDEVYDLVKDKFNNFKQINDKFMSSIEEDVDAIMSVEDRVLKGDLPDPTLGYINLKQPLTEDDFVDYIFSLSDNNVVSSRVMSMLYTKLNGRRKIDQMNKSSVDRKEDSKYYGLISKTSLIKYLSKPPYNTKLKTLMWKIGESFVKVSNKGSLYGKLYKERKEYETKKNNNYEYWEQAAYLLRTKNYNKNSETYKWLSQGMLSPAHINERAKRWAVKIFICHFFEMCYLVEHDGHMPQTVYPVSVLGHVDYIAPEVPYSLFVPNIKPYTYPTKPINDKYSYN